MSDEDLDDTTENKKRKKPDSGAAKEVGQSKKKAMKSGDTSDGKNQDKVQDKVQGTDVGGKRKREDEERDDSEKKAKGDVESKHGKKKDGKLKKQDCELKKEQKDNKGKQNKRSEQQTDIHHNNLTVRVPCCL
jgi:hypothetical protein